MNMLKHIVAAMALLGLGMAMSGCVYWPGDRGLHRGEYERDRGSYQGRERGDRGRERDRGGDRGRDHGDHRGDHGQFYPDR